MTHDEPIWERSVGSIPFKVTVFEMATRKRVLYLRWRRAGNWKYESLAPAAGRAGFAAATLYDERGRRLTGRKLNERQQWAIAQAEAKFAQLRAGLPDEEPKAPLTLGETWDIVSDEKTGKYPVDSPHRREVHREFIHATRILGATSAWESIRTSHLTALWRTRIQELRADDHDGLRGAEVCVARVLAIAQWLRNLELIPKDACVASSAWKDDLRADWLKLAKTDRLPEPARPRHSADEYRKLFDAAWAVDPRLGLAYSLGAELRGGQVKRARRSDLDLAAVDADKGEFGAFRVPGLGKKRGTVVHLTKKQRADVDRALEPESGYLRELEAAFQKGELRDYFLFPSGQLPGGRAHRRGFGTREESKWRVPDAPVATVERHTQKHVTDTAIRKWFAAAEGRAEIQHQPGRGWYGSRRQATDLAKAGKISREGLREHGGWSSEQVPDAIYADDERDYARKEARDARAKMRRETDG